MKSAAENNQYYSYATNPASLPSYINNSFNNYGQSTLDMHSSVKPFNEQSPAFFSNHHNQPTGHENISNPMQTPSNYQSQFTASSQPSVLNENKVKVSNRRSKKNKSKNYLFICLFGYI